MTIKWVFYYLLYFFTCLTIQAQVIEKNDLTIGAGYEHNIFDSPKNLTLMDSLIQNDFYYLFENEFEVSKKIKQSKHSLNLKTAWHTFTNYKTLNKSNIKLQYTLKQRFSQKLKFNLRAVYFKNKAFRTNILGERLRYAYHYQTFNVSPLLNYTLSKQCKFKLSYFYAPYFYFKDNADYNYHKNELNVETTIALKHVGYTKKKLKFSLDISNRNYLYKISRNRLGKRSDNNNLWNWTYYSASINYFEEVDYDKSMRIGYHITQKDDNFEGYYNYIQQNILFNYSYEFDQFNTFVLAVDIGFRKYKNRFSANEQQLRYFYPEVDLQYHRKIKEQLKLKTVVQTYSRSTNFEDTQSLTKRNYFSLFMEVSLSYNFAKND